eukprot:Trichotokara_eunicae@DN4110_c0_g1_i1.p1
MRLPDRREIEHRMIAKTQFLGNLESVISKDQLAAMKKYHPSIGTATPDDLDQIVDEFLFAQTKRAAESINPLGRVNFTMTGQESELTTKTPDTFRETPLQSAANFFSSRRKGTMSEARSSIREGDVSSQDPQENSEGESRSDVDKIQKSSSALAGKFWQMMGRQPAQPKPGE